MTQNRNLAALSEAGVSVWLDDLSRDRLRSGNLAELISTKSVVGVTTNPSIVQAALSAGTAYDAQVGELASRGADVDANERLALRHGGSSSGAQHILWECYPRSLAPDRVIGQNPRRE